MKYTLIHNIEWDYDAIEWEEILLFLVPDGFQFNDNLFEEYLKYKDMLYKKISDGWFRVYLVDKKTRSKTTNLRIDVLLRYKNDPRHTINKEDFINWCIKYKQVQRVEYELY